jgi:hypothetical protein
MLSLQHSITAKSIERFVSRFRLPRAWAFDLLFVCIGLALVSCGGGGGGGSSSAGGSSRGVVVLPQGFKEPLSALQLSGMGLSKVSGNGTFSYQSSDTNSSMLVLTDSTGKGVLFGFSYPSSGKPAEISVTQTAIALLFYATGSFTLPFEQHETVLNLLAADPSIGPLAQSITQQIAGDPTAISDNNTTITAAVQTALNSMQGSRAVTAIAALRHTSAAASPPFNPSRQVAASGRSASSRAATLMRVQPTQTQSGLILAQSDDQTGLQITNTFRRSGLYFITETTYEDANGNTVNKTPPLDLATGTDAQTVPSVNKLNGAIGSIIDVLRGNGAYQPKNAGAPIPLPLDPPDAKQTVYHVTIVGPGLDPGTQPQIPGKPYLQQANWAMVKSLVKDIVIPLSFAALDKHINIEELQEQGPLLQSFRGFLSLGAIGGHVYLNLTGTTLDPTELIVTLSKAIVDDPVFRQAFVQWVNTVLEAVAEETGKQIASAAVEDVLTRFNLILSIIDKGLALGDAARVAADWGQSQWFNEWDVTVVNPSVHLSPGTATVTNVSNIATFTAAVTGQDPSTLRFAWSTSGTQGSLEHHPAGGALPSGPITDSSVDYVTNLSKAKNGASDTVTVTAYDASDLNIPIGSVTSTVTYYSTNCVSDIGAGPWPGGGYIGYEFISVPGVAQAQTFMNFTMNIGNDSTSQYLIIVSHGFSNNAGSFYVDNVDVSAYVIPFSSYERSDSGYSPQVLPDPGMALSVSALSRAINQGVIVGTNVGTNKPCQVKVLMGGTFGEVCPSLALTTPPVVTGPFVGVFKGGVDPKPQLSPFMFVPQ